MHIIHLFQYLLFSPDIHVTKATLPDAEVRLIVHGRGQGESGQHPSAPSVSGIFAQGFQDEPRGASFQLLMICDGLAPADGHNSR